MSGGIDCGWMFRYINRGKGWIEEWVEVWMEVSMEG